MWMPLGWVSATGVSQAASFELISTTVLASATPSVTFNISAGQQAAYKHLQLRIVAQAASGGPDMLIQFNGDTAANYSYHILYGNGANVLSTYSAPSSSIGIGNATATANLYTGAIVDILDAFNTNKYKTTRSLFGVSVAPIGLWSGNWRSTSAISSITVLNASALNYTVGSRFSLYGVRG